MANTAPDPNRAQIEYWNAQTGPKWVGQQVELDHLLAALGTAAMDRLGLLPGAQVLDVGCGCGDTTLALARRVGSTGSVLGIDVSAPMLARARERAREWRNVRFVEADAQTHRLDPASVDAIFSRFGVMFFADPTAAFANVLTALRPGGELAFVCWQAMAKNPWCLVPLAAIAPHVPLPPPPAPDEPGPFSFGDQDRVRRVLDGAGFTHVRIVPLETPLNLSSDGTLDQAVRFATDAGPASRLLRDAPPDVMARVRQAIREALAPHAGVNGVQLASACWIVTAKNVS
jgi:SAM-dependent methyltransferase